LRVSGGVLLSWLGGGLDPLRGPHGCSGPSATSPQALRSWRPPMDHLQVRLPPRPQCGVLRVGIALLGACWRNERSGEDSAAEHPKRDRKPSVLRAPVVAASRSLCGIHASRPTCGTPASPTPTPSRFHGGRAAGAAGDPSRRYELRGLARRGGLACGACELRSQDDRDDQGRGGEDGDGGGRADAVGEGAGEERAHALHRHPHR